jgi:hypothetical protein
LFSGGLFYDHLRKFGSIILISLASLSISILVIISAISVLVRINIDYSNLSQAESLKYLKVERTKNVEYTRLLKEISEITDNQNTPILFFGHNSGDSFVAENLQTPNTYFPVPSAIQYNP